MRPILEPGTPAPDFEAFVVGGAFAPGETIRLSALKGQTVVLYFYPKDDTPGCTRQACALRDDWDKIARKARVVGVSIDSVKSHEKFIKKHSLPFPLISDEDRKIVEAYGVWVEKRLYGRKYWGTERSTFVIDRDGVIQAVLRKVSATEHLDLLLKML